MRIIVPFVLASAFILAFMTPQEDVRKKVIGTWKWEEFRVTGTEETLSLDDFLGGMVKEVRIEYRPDGKCLEYKMGMGIDSLVPSPESEWKLEDNGKVLTTKGKDGQWMPSDIVELTRDRMVLAMNPRMELIMVRVQ